MNCRKEDMVLYAITDRHWLNGESLYQQVEKALQGGVTFLQLREKNLDKELFMKEAREIKELCRKYKVPFIINDNVEIAKAIDADGVHVGQSDMEAGDVRKRLAQIRLLVYLPRRLSRLFLQRSMVQIIWVWELFFLPVLRQMQLVFHMKH